MTTSDTVAESVFDSLSAPVQTALAERGFDEPTEPQERAIPPLTDGDHGLIIAPTGTGKTETAMLPVFDAIVHRGTQYGISALYITPLRALNRDMQDRLSWWGGTLDIDVDVRHGDTTQYRRRQQALDPPDVLVTTPETLQAMLTGERLRDALKDVRHVIVDEVHELAGSKRGAQLSIGLERLGELAGDFQRIGLSATVGDPAEVGVFLTGGEIPALIEIDAGSRLEIAVREPPVTRADHDLAGQLATDPEIASHVRAIRDIVERYESTLIFVNTRQTAEAMGARFKSIDANIGVHHGSLSTDARIDVEARFKTGDIDALICTSSMELGIDVGRVDHVIQYGSPREVTRLLQRVGRAGHRVDRVSLGTIITRHPDDTLEALAIARRALDDQVEPAKIHHGSLDVVANQLAGLVMDFGEISARRAYTIVTRAYPFRDLTEPQFKSIVRELAGNRVIWLNEEDDQLEKRQGTWQYFYANLSMIPDEETYAVTDMASGHQIGTLDERFVVNFAEPGATFIQGGNMWRVVTVDEEDTAIKAAPIEDPTGEIPSWVGEEIPVPFAIAQEVGGIRRTVATRYGDDASPDDIADGLCTRYPSDTHTVENAIAPIIDQIDAGDPVPTAEHILVEGAGDMVVINVCAGHQVNETIGRLCSALIGQATGSSVGMDIDPYRVELTVPANTTVDDAVAVLTDTDPGHVEPLLALSLKRSETLAFTLAQVAAVFGALKRWQGSGNVGSNRLRAALADTPVYDEAIREIFHDDLAVDQTSELLDHIRSGKFSISTIRHRTPIGQSGQSSGKELLTPENADASVIRTVKNRLHSDKIRLFCVHCTDWERTTSVDRVPDQPECPQCGSTRIAALSPWADDVVTAVRSGEKTPEQDKMTRRAHWSANVVQSHGKRAVIALAARGVGPQSAARIINKWREDDADFYRDIIRREREYARTRSFWD